MNFKRVMAAMIVSCSLVSVVSPLEMGVNDINETAEAAQEETELNIEVEPVNAPIVSAEPEIEWKTGYVSASKLNIRKKPSTDSKIVGSLSFNKKRKSSTTSTMTSGLVLKEARETCMLHLNISLMKRQYTGHLICQ